MVDKVTPFLINMGEVIPARSARLLLQNFIGISLPIGSFLLLLLKLEE